MHTEGDGAKKKVHSLGLSHSLTHSLTHSHTHTHTHTYIYIATGTADYLREFGLDIAFIDHLNKVNLSP
jgi:hypothetical protein